MTVFGGDIIYAADINAIFNATLDKPIGRLTQAVQQTGIVNNTMTAATFTTEVFDTHDFHSTSVNTSRVTPTTEGTYLVRGSVAIQGQTDYTTVEVVILKNGTAQPPATRLPPTTASQTTMLPASCYVDCNGSTDYFEIGFRLNRSGAGTSGTAGISSQFATTLEWELSRDRP